MIYMTTTTHVFPAHPRHTARRPPRRRGYSSSMTNPYTTKTQKGSLQSQSSHPSAFHKPALSVISNNIEGFSKQKSEILACLCESSQCDVICVRETHRGKDHQRPEIPGMSLIAEIPHLKYGSAIFAKPSLSVGTTSCESSDDIKLTAVETANCCITSVYKPPNQKIQFKQTPNFYNKQHKILIGDFNSHSTTWSYSASMCEKNVLNLFLLHSTGRSPAKCEQSLGQRQSHSDAVLTLQKLIGKPTPKKLTPRFLLLIAYPIITTAS